jgi:hypothetical protein
MEGVDDWDKAATFYAGAFPRRSTSSLDPMDALPSFWTAPLGFLMGILAISRVARWLQGVLALWAGNSTGQSPSPRRPELLPLLLTTIAHPTPWLVLIGGAWIVHRLFVSPVTTEWRWFLVGFICGPAFAVALVYFRLRRARLRLAPKIDPPAS